MSITHTISLSEQNLAHEDFRNYLNEFESNKQIRLEYEKPELIKVLQETLPKKLQQYVNANSVIVDVFQTIICGPKVVNLFVGHFKPIRIDYIFENEMIEPQILSYSLNGEYYESLSQALYVLKNSKKQATVEEIEYAAAQNGLAAESFLSSEPRTRKEKQ